MAVGDAPTGGGGQLTAGGGAPTAEGGQRRLEGVSGQEPHVPGPLADTQAPEFARFQPRIPRLGLVATISVALRPVFGTCGAGGGPQLVRCGPAT